MDRASRSQGTPQNLAGITVLVVEDDYFVASDTATVLADHGARVLGPVPDLARARGILAAESPDCALLDVNLKGQFVFELAEELQAHGVPAIFATGYDISILPPGLRNAPCLQKPVESRELVRVIRDQATRS
jgi:DNA-binding response OmpR family regulator